MAIFRVGKEAGTEFGHGLAAYGMAILCGWKQSAQNHICRRAPQIPNRKTFFRPSVSQSENPGEMFGQSI